MSKDIKPTDLNKYIDEIKKKHSELKNKQWNWRSFYNGALEGFGILLPKITKLESDSLEAIDLMIIDRDAFHDKNVELEKKLDKLSSLLKTGQSEMDLREIRMYKISVDNFLKGESQ